jgi:hypothetical protein
MTADHCVMAVDRLQAGFDSLSDWESDSFWDESFEPYGSTSIWTEGFTPYDEYSWFESSLSKGTLYFTRFLNEYSDAELWGSDGEIGFTDIVQGNAPAYLKASLSSFAEFPDLVRSAILNDGVSDNGIYNVRFYIRGKPWVVSIDDYFPFEDASDPELLFGAIGEGNAMWGPLLLKAWAKVKGNYLNGRFDLTANGIRALTGVPVFDYYSAEFGESEDTMDEMWDLLLEAEAQNFLISASSNGLGGDYYVNGCGIEMAHSYSVVAAFDMTDADGHANRCLLMRNPRGANGYNWRWSASDPKWSDGMAAQVPFGFDPREEDPEETGLFIVPFEAFLDNPGIGYCFVNIQIGHNRADEDYEEQWYDVIDASDDEEYTFFATGDTSWKPIYFTVETYGFNIIPLECTTAYDDDIEMYSEVPFVTFTVSWETSAGDQEITK